MHMDNGFECLRDDLCGGERKIDLNIVAANEHEPNIERCIRHVKERCRCTFAAIQFSRLPRRLTVALVDSVIYWINCAPRRDGVHPVMSPRTIMTGHQLTVKNVEFQFGDFVQATQPPKTSSSGNNMDEQTSDAIYCFPSGNTQGGFWVYKLSTNQVVHRNQAKLAHSNDVIAQQVEAIASNENVPDGLTFGDRTGKTTILDFETEAFDFDDDLSDGEYHDGSEQELEENHDIEDEDYDEIENAEEDNGDAYHDDDGIEEYGDANADAMDNDDVDVNSDADEDVNADENVDTDDADMDMEARDGDEIQTEEALGVSTEENEASDGADQGNTAGLRRSSRGVNVPT